MDSVKAYLALLGASARGFFGSRLFVAVSAVFALGFAAQASLGATRPPPVSLLSLAQLGLVTPVPKPAMLPEVEKQLGQAKEAAKPYVSDAANEAFAVLSNDQELAKAINYTGLGASVILTLLGLLIQWNYAKTPGTSYRDEARWWSKT